MPTAKNGQGVGLDPRARGRVDRANAAHERWRIASGTPDVASPVAGDGKVYLAGRDGAVAVLAAGRTFKLLSLNKLGDPLDASRAISGGRIYLRGAAQLWAVGAR